MENSTKERDRLDLELAGKVAWVTGGSAGIGLACARALANEGARVAVSARNEEKLKEAAAQIESETGNPCAAFPLDVNDADAIARVSGEVADWFGDIDILVSNAGGPTAGSFLELSDDDLQAALSLTTASAWRLAAAVVPSMKERGSGCLIFITSTSTKEVLDGLLLSNTARAAVNGMNKTLSRELGPHGIRSICIAPGRVDTDRSASLDRKRAEQTGMSQADARADREGRIPLHRYGYPDELGAVVAFVASPKASYLTGVNIMVDGGDSTTVMA